MDDLKNEVDMFRKKYVNDQSKLVSTRNDFDWLKDKLGKSEMKNTDQEQVNNENSKKLKDLQKKVTEYKEEIKNYLNRNEELKKENDS